jgi:hypothetical protein
VSAYRDSRRIYAKIAMELTYFEVVFCRNDGEAGRFIRVCIGLNDEDKDLLNSGESVRLITLELVHRSGVLDFLQISLKNWHCSGRVMGLRECRETTAAPETLNGRKIWTMTGG